MDSMRGNFGSLAGSESYDLPDSDVGGDVPPASIGQDERRMQVRAYNHWASLLTDRNFPAIEDLEPDNLPDFGPYSVLLDFSTGIENPGIAFLGDKLAEECDVHGQDLQTLDDVPSRSLLSRITDHYMQILANQAPIGFEAEFVNQRGSAIAYRGILLPFSSDDDTIDFIYGVINWKELADAQASDELLLEIDQALEAKPSLRDEDAPLTDWADGPGMVPANDEPGDEEAHGEHAGFEEEDDYAMEKPSNVLPMPSFGSEDLSASEGADAPFELHELASDDDAFPDEKADDGLADDYEPALYSGDAFGEEAEAEEDEAGDEDEEQGSGPYGSLLRMPLDLIKTSEKAPMVLPELDPSELELAEFAESEYALSEPAMVDLDPAEMGLGDWLAAAREMAVAARGSEDRTREALYDAIGRAYDFSLAAAEAPAEFEELVADSGLTTQDRAPMTPVVKLVFGADYDKTRLTEYAAALTHAHRIALPCGTLGDYLREADGGLKGVVKAERRLRKEEAGKVVEPLDAPREALAMKLRALPVQGFEAIAADGAEFALVMIRRTEDGDVVVLGEVPDDVALVERAARRLVG